ncbi:MAG: hypothetical protein SPK26_16655 [Treponema sp.]|nr:hypothetical protein [Treponema sp.]
MTLKKMNIQQKTFIQVQQLVNLFFQMIMNIVFFDLHAEEISGSFMVGSRVNYYQYPKIELIKIEKIKRKNLDFYTGKVGDWHSVVIMSLDNHDYHDFYKSQNRRRYLFFLLKNGDYNFSTKDSSVYNLYSAFCASIKDMKYAAILE